MPKIKQLSAHEVQKIAAGEVVERPANIVKELIENAIDAQATKIMVYLEDSGKKLIRIIDSGYGMSPDDAQLCFAQHATSKITSVNQLQTINTFGFRGEALGSIAAVSKVTLITKEKDRPEGTKVLIEGNKIKKKQTIGCATGTDIAVRNLFYNIPARQKFLKKAQTELRHIQQLFQAFCFSYPSIHFMLHSEGRLVYNCPSTDNPTSRCMQVWENNNAQHMLTINTSHDHDNFTIKGIISNHQHYRYDRSSIFFFVNHRWVKNFQLSKSLLKGYLNVIPQGRYPLAVINISIDPTVIDINIHPRKEEVKFMHPRRVEQLIQKAVKEALENNLSSHIKQSVTFNSTQHPSIHSPPLRFGEHSGRTDLKETPFNTSSVNPEYPAKLQTNTDVSLEVAYKLIGQFNKTYILIEKENGLFLVDQHAAQERILYELFSSRFQDIATIKLIFPQIISITHSDLQTLEPHLNIFHQNGISIELFGTNQLKVESTPVHLKNQSLDDLVQQVIAWIKEYNALDSEEFFKTINEKLHAQMACKAAVKAGDVLTHEQMERLLNDLQTTSNRFACPHGRPTGWLLSIDEIEKKFKRRL